MSCHTGSPTATGDPAGHRSLPTLSLFSFLLIACLLPSCASSEHSANGKDLSVIRLPSEDVGSRGQALCAPSPAASCPVRCFRTNPVCGEDGVTYWCGCADAACAGVSVAKRGFCEVGNSGGGQALLLVHIVWLVVLGFSVVFGLF